MSTPVRIALLGFSEFERSALVSYFQLTAQRQPSYVHALALDDAEFVVADAEEPGTLALLQELGRSGDAVFVGAQGPGDAAGWMMRPINPAQVLRALDSLQLRRSQRDDDERRSGFASTVAAAFPGTVPGGLYGLPARVGGAAPAAVPLPTVTPTLPAGLFGDPQAPQRPGPLRTIGSTAELDILSHSRRADDRAEPARLAAARQQASEARRRRREASLRPDVLRRALLVDDSEVALHFLRRLLEPYGLQVDVARDSERALDLLTHQPYGLVFLDIDLGPHSRSDGLSLCHRIRHQLVHPGGRAPAVVMVSAFHEPVDQVRGTLAGAEASLAKPLDAAALDRLMRRHGFSRPAPAGAPLAVPVARPGL